jgi:hypothetical protein
MQIYRQLYGMFLRVYFVQFLEVLSYGLQILELDVTLPCRWLDPRRRMRVSLPVLQGPSRC